MDKIWRCANRLLMYHSKNKLLYLLGKLFEGVSFVVYSHAVSAKAKIGEGTEFFHHAIDALYMSRQLSAMTAKFFNMSRSERNGEAEETGFQELETASLSAQAQ